MTGTKDFRSEKHLFLREQFDNFKKTMKVIYQESRRVSRREMKQRIWNLLGQDTIFGRIFGAAWRRDNKESCGKKGGIAQESIKISGVFVSDKEESDNNDEKHNIVKRVKLTDAAKGKARKWSDFGEMY